MTELFNMGDFGLEKDQNMTWQQWVDYTNNQRQPHSPYNDQAANIFAFSDLDDSK